MTSTAARLFERAILRLAPLDPAEDVRAFLQGLVTNDVSGALPVWAGLLSPQGKVLFDFLVWPDGEDALLIDCEAAQAEALAKRLTLYRLRRRIAIARADELGVFWTAAADDRPQSDQGACDQGAWDPRLAALGWRRVAPASSGDRAADSAWLAHRLSLGVTEGAVELGSGEVLWLECNAADLNGVSFTKGCYVGQENTARMNWRQKVNRRLVVVPLGQSDPARQRAAYPGLGLAVDHRRVEDIPPDLVPGWMALTPQA
ncbi:MAG: YgfZ/GcvT domain-containing protein [Novosphingobium sp.]